MMRKIKKIIFCTIITALCFTWPGCDNDPDYTDYVYPAASSRTNLSLLVDSCNDIISKSEAGMGKGQYLSHIYKNFQTAITNARNVLGNDKATQPMVDVAYTRLTTEKILFLTSVNEDAVDPNDINLVLHLKFNGNIKDNSPEGHLLSLSPGGSLTGNGPRPSFSTDRFGRENMAMHFEKGGNISIPYIDGKSESLNPEIMTFMCWIKESITPAPVQRWIFCLDTWNIFFVVIPSGGNEFQFGGQSTRGWLNLMNAGFGASSTWTHITVTYSPQEIAFYRNGELIRKYESNGGNLVRNGAKRPFYIGIMDPSRELYYEGEMDEFRLYNKALLPNEILAVYNIEKP